MRGSQNVEVVGLLAENQGLSRSESHPRYRTGSIYLQKHEHTNDPVSAEGILNK